MMHPCISIFFLLLCVGLTCQNGAQHHEESSDRLSEVETVICKYEATKVFSIFTLCMG